MQSRLSNFSSTHLLLTKVYQLKINIAQAWDISQSTTSVKQRHINQAHRLCSKVYTIVLAFHSHATMVKSQWRTEEEQILETSRTTSLMKPANAPGFSVPSAETQMKISEWMEQAHCIENKGDMEENQCTRYFGRISHERHKFVELVRDETEIFGMIPDSFSISERPH